MKFNKGLSRTLVGVFVLCVATASFADDGGFGVNTIISSLALAVAAASTIGSAWLGFTAGISIWRNLRSAAK